MTLWFSMMLSGASSSIDQVLHVHSNIKVAAKMSL